MKKEKVLTYLLLILCFSCKKDFLQKDTGVELSNEDVFTSYSYTLGWADNSYSFLINDYAYFNGFQGNSSEFSDESIDASNSSVALVNKGLMLDPNAGDMSSIYSKMYRGIFNVNTFLANYQRVPSAANGGLDVIKAEQFFLRSFFYFELWKRWGDVIIVDHPLGIFENQDLPRTDKGEVLNFILNDLDSSISIFTRKSMLTRTGSAYGRASLTTAMALKSRVLLYAASPRFNTTNDIDLWQAAADVSAALLSLSDSKSLFSLEPKYGNLLTTPQSTEYIMIQNRPARSFSNNSFLYNFIVPSSSGGFGTFNPTENHAELYEMSNGLPITDPLSGYDSTNPFLNRDPRFYNNLIYNGMTWQKRTIAMWDASSGTDYNSANNFTTRTGFYCKKFWPEVYKAGSTGTSIINYIYFRYGELLLNYAEALNEAQGPTFEVYNAINQIRTRAKMPDLPAGLSQDSMRSRIHNERAVELAFEEHRWWDILRWKQGAQIVAQPMKRINVSNAQAPYSYSVVNLPTQYQKVFYDKMYFYPIPKVEMQKSNGVLKQTQGW